MREGLGLLIFFIVVILVILGYVDGKSKQSMMDEIERLKFKLDCYEKTFGEFTKRVDYRLSFDEKCLYDLIRKTEEPKVSHKEDKK